MEMRKNDGSLTDKICQAVQLLPEHARAVRPPRDLAVEKVEHESRQRESEGLPQVALVMRLEVASGAEDGHGAAHPIRDRHQVGQPKVPAYT